MEVVRRNTDYALRLMVNLARHYSNGPVSTRTAASEEKVSYQFACKLMQKLHGAKLVESSMGPQGGFCLGKEPSKISMLEVIEAIQGPVRLNICSLGTDLCARRSGCPILLKLVKLQQYVYNYLGGITLDELSRSGRAQEYKMSKSAKGERNDL